MPQNEGSAKISGPFAARLSRLPPRQKLRAVLLLRRPDIGKPAGRDGREAFVAALRQALTPAVDAVDEILSRHDGRRLADAPDALGSLAVETTPAGIRALAESAYVRAILEDQPLSALSSSGA